MRLKLVAYDADAIRIACEGQITQKELEPGRDLMGELLPGGDYGRKVLFNLEKTTYVDSSGIGWLVVCQKRFVQAKGQLVLYNVPPMVMQVLEMLRMHLIMNIASNETAARQFPAERAVVA
jgi:anti-anti-sigma factor